MMKNFVHILESSSGDQGKREPHSSQISTQDTSEDNSNQYPISIAKISYCERFLEFLIDLEAQLPTRRFFNTLLEDHQIVTLCKLSTLASDKVSGTLFSQLLDILVFYTGFEINGHTGLALTKEEMIDIHASKLTKLQVCLVLNDRIYYMYLAIAADIFPTLVY